MKFRQILDFPNKLKYRQDYKINPINIKKIEKNENKVDITAEIQSSDRKNIWTPSILFLNENVKLDANILVDCNCHSFNYEFYAVLHDNNALKYPNRFDENKLKINKRLGNTLSVCKHLIYLAKIIYHNTGKINKEHKI